MLCISFMQDLREILCADNNGLDKQVECFAMLSPVTQSKVCVHDFQISKEEKKLGDRDKWRVLEKSNFRPTDLATQNFKKEKFRKRWSITCAILFYLASLYIYIKQYAVM